MNKKMSDRVILATYGKQSKCRFVRLSEYHAFLKTLPEDERQFVMTTETDIDADDLDFIERSQAIIDRCELEAREAQLRLVEWSKSRKKTA
jgi:hypothetical protein